MKTQTGKRLPLTAILAILAVLLAGCVCFLLFQVGTGQGDSNQTGAWDINEKMSRLDMANAHLDDIIRIFGEPSDYSWENEIFSRDKLPSVYLVRYGTGGVSFLMMDDRIAEVRFASYSQYAYKNAVKMGTSLEEAMRTCGPPLKTVEGGHDNHEDGVLYKDINGLEGFCIYRSLEHGIMLFFDGYKVSSLYLISGLSNNALPPFLSTQLSPDGQLAIVRYPPEANWSFLNNERVDALPVYDPGSDNGWQIDLRSRDIAHLDLNGRLEDLQYADFDSDTQWPASLPDGFDPRKIMHDGMNPGLGIKQLHEAGIDGRGVNMAFVDQALLVDHIEYKDRVRLYEEIHCGDFMASMHAPSMVSQAAGVHVGVAPGADVYAIGCTNYNNLENQEVELDFTYVADAVNRLVTINESLPAEDKIRVISLSMSFCPDNKGYAELTQAIARAVERNIFVVSCNLFETYDHQFWYHGLDRSPQADPEQTSSYSAIPWEHWIPMIKHIDGTDRYYEQEFDKFQPAEILLIPMCSRTSASPTGTDKYAFYREGGWSSVEPYLAGLYALACQVKPDVTPEVFWGKALETGEPRDILKDGKTYTGKVINPVKLIEGLQS